MGRFHGIISTTWQNLILDAGAVYSGYTSPAALGTLLGATRGGNVFSIEPEWKKMDVDGAHGDVKGDKRLVGISVKITANFLAIDMPILLKALPGSTATNVGVTHKSFTRSLAITAGDYETNIAIIGEVSGSDNPIICVISNALAIGNLEISFVDKDEAVIPVEFKGHFAADDLDTEPWQLLFPFDVSTPTPAP